MNAIATIIPAGAPATTQEEWIDRGRTLADQRRDVEQAVVAGTGLGILLRYDGETGRLFWLPRSRDLFPTDHSWKTWNTRYADEPAFTSKNGCGYLHGAIFGKNYAAHRVGWAIHHGRWPDGEVDHINGDRSDNRMANLRDVTTIENRRNQIRSAANASGVTGVHWCNTWNRWIARIGNKGKMRTIGNYANFDEAVAARLNAERELGFAEGHGKEPVKS